ncbi:Bud-site selection protein [Lipomyces japonicus]|uniref:Bud-site selection protein n=1 Tax=Lipomyces japonicus TaxID=56871 RepID=UPI0034CDE52C
MTTNNQKSKRKRENVLWELDLLESRLSNGSKKPRLIKTKLTFDRIKRNHDKAKSGQDKDATAREAQKHEANKKELLDKAHELKRKLVEQKIYYWMKEVTRGLKKARPQETQKIVRKLKEANAAKNEILIKRLEEELLIIKSLDAAEVAQAHVWKKCKKHRFLYASKLLPDESPILERDSNASDHKVSTTLPAQADLIARLFKNKLLQTTITNAMEGIISAAELAMNSSKKVKKVEAQVGSGLDEHDGSDQDNEHDEVAEIDSSGEDSENDGSRLQDDHDDDELVDVDLDEFSGMIANDSDDSADASDREVASDIDYNEITSDEGEPDFENDEPTRFDDNIPEKATKKVKQISKSETERKKPIVLPSLNVGYISASDDEFEQGYDDDNDEQELSKSLKPARKNRRGQRARQKIWEQKYGKKAKHVAKEESERRAKEQEKFEKKKARYLAKLREAEVNNTNNTPLGTRSTVPDPAALVKQAKADPNKPIHPSWAARQAKSKPVDFKGKKVVFD